MGFFEQWLNGWLQLCRCGADPADEEEVSLCTGTYRYSPNLRELALEYAWAEVAGAIAKFNPPRVLGSGLAGTVYQGQLAEGVNVAIKVIEEPLLETAGFEEEVRTLSRCHHPNVVMFLGFAREHSFSVLSSDDCAGRSALVYELLPGGDAFARLYAFQSNYPWRERLRTVIDVARGLSHLHKHRPEIFHRDIKTANILFSLDGTAKIADFGLACFSKARKDRFKWVDLANGTPGYADPIYAETAIVTEASEVYSLGMVLLEVLTGRPPAVPSVDGTCFVYLRDQLRLSQDQAKERVLGCLDHRVTWPRIIPAALTTLGLLCIHEEVERRPSFIELVNLLQDVDRTATELVNLEAAEQAKMLGLQVKEAERERKIYATQAVANHNDTHSTKALEVNTALQQNSPDKATTPSKAGAALEPSTPSEAKVPREDSPAQTPPAAAETIVVPATAVAAPVEASASPSKAAAPMIAEAPEADPVPGETASPPAQRLAPSDAVTVVGEAPLAEVAADGQAVSPSKVVMVEAVLTATDALNANIHTDCNVVAPHDEISAGSPLAQATLVAEAVHDEKLGDEVSTSDTPLQDVANVSTSDTHNSNHLL